MGFALVLNLAALNLVILADSIRRANERKNAYYERISHELAGNQH